MLKTQLFQFLILTLRCILVFTNIVLYMCQHCSLIAVIAENNHFHRTFIVSVKIITIVCSGNSFKTL